MVTTGYCGNSMVTNLRGGAGADDGAEDVEDGMPGAPGEGMASGVQDFLEAFQLLHPDVIVLQGGHLHQWC